MNGRAMVYFFNNCRRRDHVALHGHSAFYDLNHQGYHATQANDLKAGDKCLVAPPTQGGGVIRFGWYEFERESVLTADDGARYRVFFGRHLESLEMPRSQAVSKEPFNHFFNVNGDFKRRSVLRGPDLGS
jgi:hypothetical protein